MSFVTRGFRGRQRVDAASDRVPPGQYATTDFPVLSAGPTPRVPLDKWRLSVVTEAGDEKTWDWDQFRSLPSESITVDIHCVTKWTKLDTAWEGVSVDTLLTDTSSDASFVLARSYGGYTTNLPRADVSSGKAWIAFNYGGEPLDPQHGGPARLLVPHLYFWKSAKWVERLELGTTDRIGFWESLGYHNYGDPWREQRYQGD
jgi:DMSO/TMAO reductase YedYZ molybdopterin-dependent catalytic subunit